MFGRDVEHAALVHARAEYPREAVGYVIDGAYCPQVNLAPAPERAFLVAPEAWSDAVQAVIHSHTNGNDAPSAADMAAQQSSAVPWGITVTDGESAAPLIWFGDHVLQAPLIGRRFVPGVTDCYALARAWFWQQRAIMLPEVPRDREWWVHGGDLLRDGFARAGFVRVAADTARHGDGLLMAILATGVINHCAVLLGDGSMLHHRAGHLSRTEPWAGSWRRLTRMVVRYDAG